MKHRWIKSSTIEKIVESLCTKANIVLRQDILSKLKECFKAEKKGTLAKKMLGVLIENASIAKVEKLPICQDTGLVTVCVEMGEGVIIQDGGFIKAINSGVKRAYQKGYFRKSIVSDPIIRKNTGTNTPAIVHLDIVKGNRIKISVMPKGFGSENKGRVCMLNPTVSVDKIVDYCVETVEKAGPDACPPYVLGIGLGGTMEFCAYLAKKALLRPITRSNPKAHIAELEHRIMKRVNKLGIGIMGVGGVATCLGVNIEEAPTHIAGLPLAVNISCHALRSASAVI